MKTIAVCMNIPELQERFRDPLIGKKYPGAGFLPHLARLCDEQGIAIQGGDRLLNKLADKPKDHIFVLQEEFNPSGLRLIEGGAHAQVLVCLESKMYAPHFYDQIPEFRKVFKWQILFEQGTHLLYFPSFDEQDIDPGLPASHRKDLCMIASNKQWWSFQGPSQSPSWQQAIKHELHSHRLRAIQANPEMDLYGPGWDNLDNLPDHWKHLKPQIEKQWKGVCEDKLKTLSQYKESICYENVHLPNYITEKPIHCVIRNTNPIHILWSDEREMRDLYKYKNSYLAHQIMELMDE